MPASPWGPLPPQHVEKDQFGIVVAVVAQGDAVVSGDAAKVFEKAVPAPAAGVFDAQPQGFGVPCHLGPADVARKVQITGQGRDEIRLFIAVPGSQAVIQVGLWPGVGRAKGGAAVHGAGKAGPRNRPRLKRIPKRTIRGRNQGLLGEGLKDGSADLFYNRQLTGTAGRWWHGSVRISLCPRTRRHRCELRFR